MEEDSRSRRQPTEPDPADRRDHSSPPKSGGDPASRRSFLASLAGIAITPALASKLIPTPAVPETLFGFEVVLRELKDAPRASIVCDEWGGFLVPEAFAQDVRDEMRRWTVRYIRQEDEEP